MTSPAATSTAMTLTTHDPLPSACPLRRQSLRPVVPAVNRIHVGILLCGARRQRCFEPPGILAPMTTRIILDVDTGTDDAVALMVAALSPDIELVGATTVNGNTALDQLHGEHASGVRPHRADRRAGARGHVAAAGPRRTPTRSTRRSRIHGDFLDLPPSRSTKGARHAVDWLIDTYMASDGDITLVPVGPLTNIATAMRKEPRIIERIPELVIMGGAHDHGNATASAEFNIFLDPEAARIVVNCGRPDPDAAAGRDPSGARIQGRLRPRFERWGRQRRRATATFIEKRIEGYDATQPMHRLGGSAGPRCAGGLRRHRPDHRHDRTSSTVDVETGGELSQGRTVCDFRGRSRKAPERPFRDGRRRTEVRRDADGHPGSNDPGD